MYNVAHSCSFLLLSNHRPSTLICCRATFGCDQSMHRPCHHFRQCMHRQGIHFHPEYDFNMTLPTRDKKSVNEKTWSGSLRTSILGHIMLLNFDLYNWSNPQVTFSKILVVALFFFLFHWPGIVCFLYEQPTLCIFTLCVACTDKVNLYVCLLIKT